MHRTINSRKSLKGKKYKEQIDSTNIERRIRTDMARFFKTKCFAEVFLLFKNKFILIFRFLGLHFMQMWDYKLH